MTAAERRASIIAKSEVRAQMLKSPPAPVPSSAGGNGSYSVAAPEGERAALLVKLPPKTSEGWGKPVIVNIKAKKEES